MDVNITQAHIDGEKPLETAILEQLDSVKFKADVQTVDIDAAGRVDINGLLMFQLPAAALTFKAAADAKEPLTPLSFTLPE